MRLSVRKQDVEHIRERSLWAASGDTFSTEEKHHDKDNYSEDKWKNRTGDGAVRLGCKHFKWEYLLPHFQAFAATHEAY